MYTPDSLYAEEGFINERNYSGGRNGFPNLPPDEGY
jgi:hypothetical protein